MSAHFYPESEMVEMEPGKWYCLVENFPHDNDPEDWREVAECVGPFESRASAEAGAEALGANPYGKMFVPHSAKPHIDVVLRWRIKNAKSPAVGIAR